MLLCPRIPPIKIGITSKLFLAILATAAASVVFANASLSTRPIHKDRYHLQAVSRNSCHRGGIAVAMLAAVRYNEQENQRTQSLRPSLASTTC
jgi:hypothetical protein